MKSPNPLHEVNIPIAIVATVLFKVFITIIGRFVVSIPIISYDFGVSYFVIAILELLGILVFLRFMELKFSIPKKKAFIYYFIAVIAGVLYVFSQDTLSAFYDLVFNTNYRQQFEHNFALPLLSYHNAALILIIPIVEELFFRKYIQNGLQKNHNGLISVLISSLLFSLAHWTDVHNTYLIFIGGLIAAFLYYKSKSVGPSILFHVVWNLTIYSM